MEEAPLDIIDELTQEEIEQIEKLLDNLDEEFYTD